ncbi:hypothetical protein Pmar_PMAR013727 [Perkinsus marinus ATCC 50983]|uniref:Uncharacterized protein n=1 Tax=Perkinsus marinus (strain ATCC 50983 / TXsc) TaxID=423536 RepID=C5LY49_PERM5|nr:hypothetical protein Pmar_PMAR013727 [Perkinsus marinus ATCC 50983]EEQ98379.1 hypothetical protein Pmar_PMAR013727 [Perkinsus marinus ATCC 50983]|eukprot:XP_002765662.1 hypothetical protein Pmar_PMAR013727 [Perkinsus marinus ATCC 50983]
MSIGSTMERRPPRSTSANLSRLMYSNKSLSIEAFNAEVRTHETSLKEKRKSLEPTASRRITMDPRKRASYSTASHTYSAATVESVNSQDMVNLEERYKQQIRSAVANRDKQIQALEGRLRAAEAAMAEKDALLLALNQDLLDKRLLTSTGRELEVAKRHLQSISQRFNLRFGVDPFSGLSGYYAVTDTPNGWPSSTEDKCGVEGGRTSGVHSSLNDSAPSVLIPDEFDSILSDGIISAEENAHIRTVIKTKHSRKNREQSPHGLLIGRFSHRNWSKSQPATPASHCSMKPADPVDEAVRALVESLRGGGVAVPSVERTSDGRAAGGHHYLIGGSIRVECSLLHGTVVAKLPKGRIVPLREIIGAKG